jgi:hypothetical protein
MQNVYAKKNASMGTQVSVLPPTLYSTYINVTLQTPGDYLVLLADDTSMYAMAQKAAARYEFY